MKNVRKSERKIAELTFQQDEDRKNRERMQVIKKMKILIKTKLEKRQNA